MSAGRLRSNGAVRKCSGPITSVVESPIAESME